MALSIPFPEMWLWPLTMLTVAERLSRTPFNYVTCLYILFLFSIYDTYSHTKDMWQKIQDQHSHVKRALDLHQTQISNTASKIQRMETEIEREIDSIQNTLTLNLSSIKTIVQVLTGHVFAIPLCLGRRVLNYIPTLKPLASAIKSFIPELNFEMDLALPRIDLKFPEFQIPDLRFEFELIFPNFINLYFGICFLLATIKLLAFNALFFYRELKSAPKVNTTSWYKEYVTHKPIFILFALSLMYLMVFIFSLVVLTRFELYCNQKVIDMHNSLEESRETLNIALESYISDANLVIERIDLDFSDQMEKLKEAVLIPAVLLKTGDALRSALLSASRIPIVSRVAEGVVSCVVLDKIERISVALDKLFNTRLNPPLIPFVEIPAINGINISFDSIKNKAYRYLYKSLFLFLFGLIVPVIGLFFLRMK